MYYCKIIIIIFLFLCYLFYLILNKLIKIITNLKEYTWELNIIRLFIVFSYFFYFNFIFFINLFRIKDNFKRNLYDLLNVFQSISEELNNILIILLKYYKIENIYYIIIFCLFIILLFICIIIFSLLKLYISYLKISFQSLHYVLQFDLQYKNFIYKIYSIYLNLQLKYAKYFLISNIISKLLIFPILISFSVLLYEIYFNNFILYHYFYILLFLPIYIFLVNLLQFYTIDKKNRIEDYYIFLSLFDLQQAKELNIEHLKYIKNVN